MSPRDYLPGLQVRSPEPGMGAILSPSALGPAATHLPDLSEDTRRVAAAHRFDDTDPSTGLMGLTLGSLDLDTTNEPDDPNTCTASDCPLQGMIHNKGLFLHDATVGLGVQFHDDFGFSNPPPFVWAAYFRYAQYLTRLKVSGDYDCEAVDSLSTEVLGTVPYDDLRPNDAYIVMGFLKYHAVTLQQRNGGLVEIQLRGEMLGGGESSMLAGLDALTL
ncbi:MAG: hypothetical protein L6R38_007538 [Xanthoria sp. 2 TBL-2021]|nr:MAG: hypothetical protein L6R38_007538 [Xanthoria sp. 2 TBL-2021]